jgi:hypothetical protein
VCALAVIGLIVGFIKGFTKTRAWGLIVLFSVLVVKTICMGTYDINGKGEFIILAAILSVLVFMILFGVLKKFIAKKVADAQKLSEYRHYDAKEENTERILTALEAGDKKTYKQSAKRKFKAKAGGWGLANRILGGVNLAFNGLMTATIVIFSMLALVDMVQIEALTQAFNDVLISSMWTEFGSIYVFDLLVCVILYASIRVGYKGGICSALSAFVIIGLLVLSGYLSYHLAFEVEVFQNAAKDMANGGMGEMISSIAGVLTTFSTDENAKSEMAVTVSSGIIMVGLFVAFLIAVIIVGIFLPKIIEKFRGDKIFYMIDGFFGATVLTLIVFALIALLFGALYTISDLPAMDIFSKYIYSSPVANAFYKYNPLQSWFGAFNSLPLRSWFVTE